MDKPQEGHKITIKLNGENKTFTEEGRKIYPEAPPDPSLQLASDDDFTDGMSETAAARESVDESFDWIIPESSSTNEIPEYKIASNKADKKKPASFSKNFNKKNGIRYASIVIPALFAILLGTTFGVGMLKLVIMDHDNKQEVSQQPVAAVNGNENTTEKTGTAAVGALTAYIVQGGLFSTKESVSNAAKQVTSLGVPAQSIEMNGKQYLYLAVADTQETAKSLSSLYKQEGVEDAFAKSFTIPEKTISKLTNVEKNFIEAAPAIYLELEKITANGIASGSNYPGLAKKMEEQLQSSGVKNEKISQLKSELGSAAEKVKSYQKSKDKKSLTDAQQHLLNFLSKYYSL